ncbi:MAG TPA: outer membrane beta-barrel protein [Stellaceae bacterium]|nr:outer membrane beta-barrel protein [Stellaceae bacterium]
MTKRTLSVLGVSLALGCAVCVSDAQAQWFVTPSGPGAMYFGVEGGWTHLEETTDKLGGLKFKEHFDDGFNVGARAGYLWGPLRFEEEFNFGQNDLTRVSGAGFNLAAHGQRNRYAVMTNAIYDFPVGWIVSPHLGVGIGAVNLHNSIGLNPIAGFAPCAAGCAVASSSAWEFGYQAIAGIRYNISPALAFDIDYRYLATTDPTFKTLGGLKYDSEYHTHNLVASLTWIFGTRRRLRHRSWLRHRRRHRPRQFCRGSADSLADSRQN